MGFHYRRSALDGSIGCMDAHNAGKIDEAERNDPPNPCPFGTFGTSPAEQAWVPKASKGR